MGGFEVLVGVDAFEDDRLAAGASALGSRREWQLDPALDSHHGGPADVENSHDILARLDLAEDDFPGQFGGKYV
jgi:hypothetical protein